MPQQYISNRDRLQVHHQLMKAQSINVRDGFQTHKSNEISKQCVVLNSKA